MESEITAEDQQKLRILLSLLNDSSQPNTNALMEVVRNINILALNVKSLGYDLARQLRDTLPPAPPTAPGVVGLPCKPSVQRDIESDWVAYWCGQLQIPVVFHRKVWELAYVLQAIWEAGYMRPGSRGLGFGCGVEALPSYLAAHGVSVTVTDLPPDDSNALGWTETNQHTGNLDQSFHAHLVDRAAFDRLVSLRYVDMNAIPADLNSYDFCWSICALEHVGSIEKGLAFIENSLETLKPGGLAVHTTELNVDDTGPTIDNWGTVLFQSKHFRALAERLHAKGHQVAPLDFNLGDQPMDRFIDVPPYSHDLSDRLNAWLGHAAHLKVATDGFVATCYGLIVKKAGNA